MIRGGTLSIVLFNFRKKTKLIVLFDFHRFHSEKVTEASFMEMINIEFFSVVRNIFDLTI